MKVETVLLKDYTTIGIGGPAELWTVETPADLLKATEAPYRVIGNGSNLLVSDEGVKERVIRLGGVFRTYDLKGWVGAGVLLPLLVKETSEAGLSGLDGLLGIPAQVGGAVRMNAGTRFGEMADALEAVEIFHEGRLEVYRPEELGFGYRSSRLPQGSIVTRVKLKLKERPKEEILRRLNEVDRARRGQPKRKSAGCAFKNPPGQSAGRLIDQLGFKGLRVGGAMVSLEHGNFIVNLGQARFSEVLALVRRIQEELPLELEWEVWT
ncbi:MAG: UDP-N-acetylmuramate dehydrogenase [Thermaceae bacterium]